MKNLNKNDVTLDPSGFVVLADMVPDIIQEIRYYSTYNFIGERIDGYEEPCALITKEAARALKPVSKELMVRGYRMKVFDAYRPDCAVKHFVYWGIEDTDIRMKPYFYPDLVKQELFKQGYIAKRSSHSRGSTIDLTLVDMSTGKELDMGSPFDLFSEVSHPDYKGITEEQFENRGILREVMLRNGFLPIDCEWWHFTLENEPYPDTYFNFPVSSEYLRR
ncbi:MAG: M15 family metallopeptidase [Lachnospiraceae bacterium]|nr:M15 family metallopeptidase [Lachnospiraceae bacterium]MBR6156790.1 M15 family metallopeptidase [Lachnospiraceae bacterium]